jgi:(2R)-ethylmalonyl-CoA mutase
MPDKPWMMRTYSGHSTARASNELYRTNLAKGQTGLSIAFDLPTQTGYDPDALEARGEVGKVGVPVAHIGHMKQLLDGIPPGEMNTSMTINAPAAWMLGLYVANAEDQGVESKALRGTTQNDIMKEYLSRGTYIFPPQASLRLIVDTIAFCSEWIPKWNPMNICSYHLQEAGATPVQEIAYSLANAIGILDAVRDSGQVAEDRFPAVVASISFFVNAGIRFVEETCKLRAFTELWDRITLERYGVTDEKARRFRYGRAPSSCRRGTRRWVCLGRGTSSGRCASSRCWRSRPTCSSTTISSTARRSSRPRPRSWPTARWPSSTTCSRSAVRSRPSTS